MTRKKTNLSRKSNGARVQSNRRQAEMADQNAERHLQQPEENSVPTTFYMLRRAIDRRGDSDYRFAFCYIPTFNYLGLKPLQIGQMNTVCDKCGAKKWKEEPNTLCCCDGKVLLPAFKKLPDQVSSLILGTHPFSKHFLENSRRYNTLFQMTSFGAEEIKDQFMPTFKIKGQVYHRIGSLLPEPGSPHQFLQIYFMSNSDQISTRCNLIPNLKKDIIELLQKTLHENNNLIRAFKFNMENTTFNDLRNLNLVIHAEKIPAGEHRGRYNAPVVDEVAALIVNEERGERRDIVLRLRSNNNTNLQRVSEIHRSYDALQYPLLHIFGEDGYTINIPQQSATNKTVSCMNFYAYRFMVRENDDNILHRFQNLFNQYAVDMSAKMITERLRWIRNNQKKLRAENYVHLKDAIETDSTLADVGQRVILPSSVTGSPRYMHEKTQDGLTYARLYGNADLFITFTCNPKWPEIKNELFENQKPTDRHDITARVFNLKLKKFMHFFTKQNAFGEVKCHMYTVEWQKRGLPHAHILLWLDRKIMPDEIDQVISAELPDKEHDPLLYDIVCNNMIHGPCGTYNSHSPCMVNGRCSKKYPRHFTKETQTGDDGYPSYRRRSPEDGGQFFTKTVCGKSVQIDNHWIVPYCPVLSRTFNAHINVESCHSIKSIKYITKYINKGSDRATFCINNNGERVINDEVAHFHNGLYLCTSQAFWRFFKFDIHEHSPAITQLAVHLENNQRVYFTNENALNVAQNPPKTTLTAFFELCASDDFAKTLLYHEVPSYFRWTDDKKFIRRKQGKNVEGYPGVKKGKEIGRVYTIHPSQSECFHLRLLLHHVRGPTSHTYIKTVDGQVHPTFKSACLALGLLESDDHWIDTLTDAAVSESPSKMRDLFAIILNFCHPSDPSMLWEKFKMNFCEDILHKKRQLLNNDNLTYCDEVFNEGLILIEDKLLNRYEKNLSEFGLPTPARNRPTINDPRNSAVIEEYDIEGLKNYVRNNSPKLVPDQRLAFDSILESVENNSGKVFFLDAPGGTGKTWLINLILADVRSKGGVALAVASSGIAATLLTGGRTAHSTFKLPLSVNCSKDFYCSIRKNGPMGETLKKTKLIVWDECTMSHRAHSEAIDRTLKDIRSSNKLMGGVTFVFAGDFRQTLPVIPKGTRADIVQACLKTSPVWVNVTTLKLRTNMRAHLGGSDSEFPSQLLKIGNGTYDNEDGYITVNNQLGQTVTSLQDLIDKVYPDIDNLLCKSYDWLCERAILTPTNESADEINTIISGMIPGEVKEYKGIDTILDQNEAVNFPTEFLNSLSPSGFPPYSLELKVGVPIMLLRNLNPPLLCNGTRLQIKVMRENVIEAIILTGPGAGELAFIPRIPMIPTDLPFQFKRLQYPVKLCFATTITKSQGQTLKYVGVDLRTECFTHGQLYVGFSRTGNPLNQFILVPCNNKIKNVVYSEVL